MVSWQALHDGGILFHAAVAEVVHPFGEIPYADHQEGQDNQADQCQAPFQVEKEDDAPHEADEVGEKVDNCAGKKPLQPLHIGRDARDQIAGFLGIKKFLGQAQGMVKQGLLDIQADGLLKTQHVILLQDFCSHADDLDACHQQHRYWEQIQLAGQDDIVHQEAVDHWLREHQHAGKND